MRSCAAKLQTFRRRQEVYYNRAEFMRGAERENETRRPKQTGSRRSLCSVFYRTTYIRFANMETTGIPFMRRRCLQFLPPRSSRPGRHRVHVLFFFFFFYEPVRTLCCRRVIIINRKRGRKIFLKTIKQIIEITVVYTRYVRFFFFLNARELYTASPPTLVG